MNSKYRAVKTEVDGIVFASKREAAAYQQFRALERSGAIGKLELQRAFPLYAWDGDKCQSGISIGKYIADFVVIELDGTRRIYDAKGVKTPVYNLKKKIFEANYGERIVEI